MAPYFQYFISRQYLLVCHNFSYMTFQTHAIHTSLMIFPKEGDVVGVHLTEANGAAGHCVISYEQHNKPSTVKEGEQLVPENQLSPIHALALDHNDFYIGLEVTYQISSLFKRLPSLVAVVNEDSKCIYRIYR